MPIIASEDVARCIYDRAVKSIMKSPDQDSDGEIVVLSLNFEL